ncbi:DUF732 domain-containing protein [Parafrankia sp. EUN1f]|uniref:DUF732 domain-containing protein n=1 Tax=Parafrankia sp. EUN1f TaxID=102897 RepID=UPI0001C44AAB|nr:DUF732 domain-containing protein [Parafrankia sp. EUN1f]EFC84053.1 hypothetical protein FrEUN1fDRAFT_2779 [Parafrankia sp. EUN1f]
MRARWVTLALLVAISGCSGSADGGDLADQPGPERFVQDVHAQGLTQPGADLLTVGHEVCEGLANPTATALADAGRSVAALKPTTAQQRAFMISAVQNLCPEHSKGIEILYGVTAK